jgi:hypothetical protein
MPAEAFKLNPIARAFGQQPDLYGGGKKGGGGKGTVGKILTVATMVAVPHVGAAVASSIGASSALAVTATQAAVGAAMGGLSAYATGGNVRQGALMGGVLGGISGYNAVPSAPNTSTITGQAGAAGYGGGGYGTIPAGGVSPIAAAPAAGLTAAPETIGQTYGGLGAQPVGLADAGVMSTFTNAPVQTFANVAPGQIGQSYGTIATAPAATPTTAALTADQIGASYASMAPGAATAPITTTAAAPAVGTGAGTGVGTESTGFIKALKDVPGKIAERFSNSEKLADMTLKAAGLLAGSYIMQPEIPQGEQDMLNAQVAELQKLRDSNEALFKQRLEQAQSLIGESKYFDPEYFGLQRARRAQLSAGRAKRAGLRGLTGAAREAEARRFDLAAGRDVGTAYDVGYGQGISGRLQTQQAGLAAMPAAYPGSAFDAGSSLMTQYASATNRARTQSERERQAAGSLFGMI